MISDAVRAAADLEQARVRLAALVNGTSTDLGLLDRVAGEVNRRTELFGEQAALESLYDDVAAGRLS